MILNDFKDKAVVITGGTAGIGLETGLEFGKLGAHVYLTYLWGTSDEGEIVQQFADAGARAPVFVEADVSRDDDTKALMEQVRNDHDRIFVMVSNAAFGHVSKGIDDLTQKALHRTLTYSAWPFVGYLQQHKETFGCWPRYAIGLSSGGPRYRLPGYDFIAAAKTTMEIYCRYLTSDLLAEDINLNIVAANPVQTRSMEATFGPEFAPFCQKHHSEDWLATTGECAGAVVALCSGLMDGIKGQLLMLDHGFGFSDNVCRLFTHREELGLTAD